MSTCQATQASCVCDLPTGHVEDYHNCGDGICGGRWPLSWEQDNAFEVTRFPGGRNLDALLGLIDGES